MEGAAASKPPRRWLVLVLFGTLFECVLLALWATTAHFSVFTQFRNIVLLIHIPLLWVVSMMNSAWLPVLLIPVPILFWAIVFDGISRLWAQIKARPIYLRGKRWWQGGLVGACLVAFAFVAVSLRSETPTPFHASEGIQAAVNGNTAFALDLYQELRKQPGNLFFSPYSVSTSLAITSAGARGQTESEMTNALHFSLPSAKIHPAFGELGQRMNQIERWNRITLETANGLWVQKDKPFNAAFLDLARNDYSAEVRQADFRSSPSKVGEEIDLWVEKQTGGKIKGAIAAGRILPDTKMILCNAIYFKGTWKTKFKMIDTKPKPFHLNPRETITVPMMYQKGEFKMAYADERIVDMLELPYSGSDLSMIILLPTGFAESSDEAEDELSAIEAKLTAERLQIWLAELDRAQISKVHVSLPRFTTTQHYELVNGLKKLGMSSAFGAEADFSGIEGTTNLFISDVVHQAFVDVNEAGTEAAAMTYGSARTKGMDGRFIADRPFIFLIRENATGSILFLGRMADPRK